MPNVGYFEIPVEDMEKGQAFYGGLFNWQFEKMHGPSEACNYWMINTGTPEESGVSIGGMMNKQGPLHTITQYVQVNDVDVHVQKVQALGGSVRVPKTAVPGQGYFVICLDPENNAFGLWQCDKSAQ